MKESFGFEGTSTGEYRGGLHAMYCGKEYPVVYLGVGRFILYSDVKDENFTFPTQDGRYLMQTDLRDENLTRVSEIRMIGIVRTCYESVTIRDILEEGIIVSTHDPRLGFALRLKAIKDLGFTGLIDRDILIGMYEERDYLWNPTFGICSTFFQATGTKEKNSWFIDNDRITRIYVADKKNLN